MFWIQKTSTGHGNMEGSFIQIALKHSVKPSLIYCVPVLKKDDINELARSLGRYHTKLRIDAKSFIIFLYYVK